jgi:hypothetical protein
MTTSEKDVAITCAWLNLYKEWYGVEVMFLLGQKENGGVYIFERKE